ncbi:MAG: alanine racemase [Cocleimonas sp.]
MNRSARISIHPQALQHNLLVAKKLAPQSKVLAVIKANAYGHGAVATAGILYDLTDAFAVSCVSEAVELRDAGIEKPITILQGHQNDNDLHIAAHYDLSLVVHCKKQLSDLDHFTGKQRFKINLKIDTGMHRLGLAPADTQRLFKQLKNHPQVNPQELILMTHLCCADELDNDASSKQIAEFNHSCQKINTPKSIANSAGILGWKESHADWIRPGIMLYGSSPFAQQNATDLNLQATMTLQAPVIATHDLNKGDSIGYGSSWTCPKDMKVAVVACGYADGYPRHAVSGTSVWINGKGTQLLGRVSMDMVVIDASNYSESPIKEGDLTEMWGQNIPIDNVAKSAETISYELLCNAGNLCADMGS